jgi:hypothetical protein
VNTGDWVDCWPPGSKIPSALRRTVDIDQQSKATCTKGNCYAKAKESNLITANWNENKKVCSGTFDCKTLLGNNKCQAGQCPGRPGIPQSCCTGDYLGKICKDASQICYPDGTCALPKYTCNMTTGKCELAKHGIWGDQEKCQDECPRRCIVPGVLDFDSCCYDWNPLKKDPGYGGLMTEEVCKKLGTQPPNPLGLPVSYMEYGKKCDGTCAAAYGCKGAGWGSNCTEPQCGHKCKVKTTKAVCTDRTQMFGIDSCISKFPQTTLKQCGLLIDPCKVES